MLRLPRVHSLPDQKNWHLRFRGHVDDVKQDDFEEQFFYQFEFAGPVVYDNGNGDDDEIILDIYLEWIAELNVDLLNLKLYGFMLDQNEMLERDTPESRPNNSTT